MLKTQEERLPKKDKRKSKHEQSFLYRLVRRLIQFFTPEMETIWQVPFGGRASVFVCNHDRAFGPIAMCAHFDRYNKIRPWINAQVLSAKETPAYVRSDYWWNPNKWYSSILGKTLAYIYALILPPILRGSDCIPVYHDTSVISTLKQSIKYLREGKDILIFPEKPAGFDFYEEEIMEGFVSIGRLYYSRTKQPLDFYPGFIDWKKRKIHIGTPLSYDGGRDYNEQSLEITRAVEDFFAAHSKETQKF